MYVAAGAVGAHRAVVSDFASNFVREPDGSWRCTSDCEIHRREGRIQVAEGSRFAPGTVFMGVDIVKLLEDGRSGGE